MKAACTVKVDHGYKWIWWPWWKFTGLFLISGFWGWLPTESQPMLLWFIFSLSKDNWPFKLEIVKTFVGILQVLRLEFQKFRILEILNFHPHGNYTYYEDVILKFTGSYFVGEGASITRLIKVTIFLSLQFQSLKFNCFSSHFNWFIKRLHSVIAE